MTDDQYKKVTDTEDLLDVEAGGPSPDELIDQADQEIQKWNQEQRDLGIQENKQTISELRSKWTQIGKSDDNVLWDTGGGIFSENPATGRLTRVEVAQSGGQKK